jgi:tetratricopeptide (TPR) repeat protein
MIRWGSEAPSPFRRDRGMMKSRRIIAVAASAVAMFTAGAVLLAAEGSRSEVSREPSAGPPLLTQSEAVSPSDIDATVAALQDRVRTGEASALDLARLGAAHLQKARTTANPRFYALAAQALRKSLTSEPSNVSALLGMGELALARHDFSDALEWGRRAHAVDKYSSTAWGVIGDAQVGLGRYSPGFNAYQRMVNLLPNLSSFARVSYARELTGDIPGAIDAMRRAARSGALIAENRAWTATQLGDLYLGTGQLEEAQRHYRAARRAAPDFTPALAGLGRVQAAHGRTRAAIDTYKRVVARLPLPQYVMTLGDLYDIAGRPVDSAHQYELVVAQQELFDANGVLPDVEMTLFFADQGGDPTTALALGQKQYRARKSVQVADALAWSLYRNGRFSEAHRVMARALRLGTRDATIHYHAGMIATVVGMRNRAVRHLSSALEINPHFSILYADSARRTLVRLEKTS